MEGQAPVKVVYIAGYGRSGSTLLDIALGQNPSIMGAGELTALARHVWDNDEYCACRAKVGNCPMWRQVVGQWQGGSDATFMPRIRKAQERIESVLSWRRFGGRAAGSHGAKRLFDHQSSRLFEILRAVSGRPIIVDSSKLPGRGFALASIASIDLYVIHLVRDGRGVAWSMMKPFERQVEMGLQKELKPRPLLYTALRWAFVNLASQLLCRKLGPRRSMRVRYEDFVEDPAKVLEQVMAMLEQQGSDIATLNNRVIFPFHQVAGSRHRMQEALTIGRDDSWRTEMPRWKQLAWTIICAPLMAGYGYKLRPAKRTNLREVLAS